MAASLYHAWTTSHGLSGPDALMSADPDHDGINQLGEYSGGGDPTDATSGWFETPLTTTDSPETGLRFSYRQRVDATVRRIIYRVLASQTLAANS